MANAGRYPSLWHMTHIVLKPTHEVTAAECCVDALRSPSLRSAELHMANLQELQERLNSDPQALQEFLADPVKSLADAGLSLPQAAQDDVKRLAAQAKTKLNAKGSSVAADNAVEIKINIPI
jgi:hypothetical protein